METKGTTMDIQLIGIIQNASPEETNALFNFPLPDELKLFDLLFKPFWSD